MNTSPENYLNDCLKRRVIFFTGKGGVGKSAVAWSVASALAHKGQKVLFINWNPFDSTSSRTVWNASVEWLNLEASQCFKEYVLQALKFEKLYDTVFENHVLKAFIRAAPGLSDTVIAGKIWDLFTYGNQDTLLIDLPSSGHTLSFFQSPFGVRKMFGMGFVHREAERICEMFVSPQARIDFVMIPEELPVEESKEFKARLEKLGDMPFGFSLMNQVLPEFATPPTSDPTLAALIDRYKTQSQSQESAKTAASALSLPILCIPRFPTESLLSTVTQITGFLEK